MQRVGREVGIPDRRPEAQRNDQPLARLSIRAASPGGVAGVGLGVHGDTPTDAVPQSPSDLDEPGPGVDGLGHRGETGGLVAGEQARDAGVRGVEQPVDPLVSTSVTASPSIATSRVEAGR